LVRRHSQHPSVFLLAAMPDRAHGENLVKTASTTTHADEEEW